MRRTHPSASSNQIERIGYRPTAPYALDIEVLSMRDLKGRVAAEELRKAHRLEFHQLICVTEGICTHVIDFSPIPCERGSVLVHQPSQTEQYDVTSAWDGWLVLFRPEFLFAPPSGASSDRTLEVNLIGILAELPRHLPLPTAEFRIFRDAISQMHADSKREGLMAEIHALLRHQLCALLIRLHVGSGLGRICKLQRHLTFADSGASSSSWNSPSRSGIRSPGMRTPLDALRRRCRVQR